MTSINIPIVGEAYTMPAKQLDAQTCINWYLIKDPGGKTSVALFPCGGLILFSEIENAKKVRGQFELNGIYYIVIDHKFYTVDANGSFTELGILSTSNTAVRIIPNDTQLFLTDTKRGYVYQIKDSNGRSAGDFFEITATSSQIGEPVFTGAGLDDMATDGIYIGSTFKSYSVVIDGATVPNTFKWSDDGGTTFIATSVTMTGSNQALNDGIEIKFPNTSGHTINDKWDFDVSVDDSFYTPVIPAYQDGYGIYVRKTSNIFYTSAIGDFSRVNALDFANSNLWPDNITAAVSIREELWLIGISTAEIWYDVGAADFPFVPRTNLMIRYGCIAPYSIVVAEDNLMLWLGHSEDGGNVVVMIVGYQPIKVSNEAIDRAMKDYQGVEKAKAGIYQISGHIFYWITFPDEDVTWEYDITTKAWHQRTSTYQNIAPYVKEKRQGQWRVNNNIYINGKHLFGDTNSGKIYELREDVYTEDGEYILRERTCQNLNKNRHRLTYNSLWIDCEKGTGLTDPDDQGHKAIMMLNTSRNEGVSWGNSMWVSYGEKGQYRARAIWHRLGQSDGFLFRIRTTDPVYPVITGAIVEAEDNDA